MLALVREKDVVVVFVAPAFERGFLLLAQSRREEGLQVVVDAEPRVQSPQDAGSQGLLGADPAQSAVGRVIVLH